LRRNTFQIVISFNYGLYFVRTVKGNKIIIGSGICFEVFLCIAYRYCFADNKT
jgi:hypothetical protein